MPNLRGASPVGRGEGDRSYETESVGRRESSYDARCGVWATIQQGRVARASADRIKQRGRKTLSSQCKLMWTRRCQVRHVRGRATSGCSRGRRVR